ncbi:dihydroorotate dehydrogenase family protein [Thermanaerovibrio velox DSM 12556]|uniref:Dihydroorotate dehydrogenase n=1 Tax=Thermanaerovibrio velox DSM 12556 TaxID=926567 RepID=H0US19_9BACT|nr:dihydroorotate oxidase [Thermanaerovibrio velox]EHM10108.1 dihydroorotate dehydrogenase family protein [Thermanaerovibrio velox DSM 12556]
MTKSFNSPKCNVPSVSVGPLMLGSPLVVASGIIPMDADVWSSIEGCELICSKGITLYPRKGNRGNRLWETPSGLLNSIGLENPGLDVFMDCLPNLTETGKKVALNMAFSSTEEIKRMLDLIYKRGISSLISVLELNLSCPNADGEGSIWGEDPGRTFEAVSAARDAWDGIIWAKLTPQARDIETVALSAVEAGADGLVVANTWLGAAVDIKTGLPAFDRVFAGLSGPAVLPLTIRLLFKLYGKVPVPLIASGGVCSAEDALEAIMAGASAVEIGTCLFRDMGIPKKILEGIGRFLEDRSIGSLNELVGVAHRGGHGLNRGGRGF